MGNDRQSAFAPYARRTMIVLTALPLLIYFAVDLWFFQRPPEGVNLDDGFLRFLWADEFGFGVFVYLIVLYAILPGLIAVWFVFAPRTIRVEDERLVVAEGRREKRYPIAKLKRVRIESHQGVSHYIVIHPATGQPVALEPVADTEAVVRALEETCERLRVPFKRVERSMNPRGYLMNVALPLAMGAILIVLLRVFLPGGLVTFAG